MKRKIIGIFICILLIGISVTSVSGDTNYEKSSLPEVKPDGLFFYYANVAGSCGIAWGYLNETTYTPDAYIESGTGSFFSFGTMLYREENGVYVNFIRDGYTIEVLWRLLGRTFLISNWQHEGLKHSITIMFKPEKETIGGFSPDETVFGIFPGHITNESESFLLGYSGIHKYGSKSEIVTGYAILIIVAEENSGDIIDFPCIYLALLTREEGGILFGKYNPLFSGLWVESANNIFGVPIDAARTFNVFYGSN